MSTANRKSSHWKKNNGRKTQQLIPIIVTWFIQLFITSRHNEYKSRSSLSEHKARTDGPRAGLVKNKRHWLESPDARHSICNDIDCGERFRKWVESSDYEWPATEPQGRKKKKIVFKILVSFQVWQKTGGWRWVLFKEVKPNMQNLLFIKKVKS